MMRKLARDKHNSLIWWRINYDEKKFLNIGYRKLIEKVAKAAFQVSLFFIYFLQRGLFGILS